jgi:hypothetical protein
MENFGEEEPRIDHEPRINYPEPPPHLPERLDPELTNQSVTIDGINFNAHDIISKLKFISKIEKSEKVASHSSTPYVVADTTWTSILRTFGYSGGSKKDTLDFIKGTTDQALDLVKRCFAMKDQFYVRIAHLIITSLKEADSGIQNLIHTYRNYRLFVSEIETFRKILDVKINSILLSSGA